MSRAFVCCFRWGLAGELSAIFFLGRYWRASYFSRYASVLWHFKPHQTRPTSDQRLDAKDTMPGDPLPTCWDSLCTFQFEIKVTYSNDAFIVCCWSGNSSPGRVTPFTLQSTSGSLPNSENYLRHIIAPEAAHCPPDPQARRSELERQGRYRCTVRQLPLLQTPQHARRTTMAFVLPPVKNSIL